MQFRDYYQILGVPRDASPENIKKAFRRLARKYHPDVSREADAEARMKEVNEAYTVLSDPEKRNAYDRLGQGYQGGQEFRPPPDWHVHFETPGQGFSPFETAGFSDFFAELFGHMGNRDGFAPHEPRFEARGQDHHARVFLDIEEAFTGTTRQISLSLPVVDARGRMHMETRTLNVKIPGGLREGQIIRLAGQGSAGSGGAQAGDLLLEVHYHPHPHLRIQGRDIQRELCVAPWEAALGEVIAVPMPNGSIRVRIPPGTQSGRQLRVRGKGLPGSPAGDLLLTLKVVLPPADSPRARELYEQMARELVFNPRNQG